MSKFTTKRILLLSVILILSIIIISSIIMSPKKTSLDKNATKEFSKDNFIESSELSNRDKLVAQNDNFEMYFNEITTHFYIKDLRTNEVWNSNTPLDAGNNVLDNFENIIKETKNLQRSTLVVYYHNKLGDVSNINNWAYSIDHEGGEQTYKVKYVDNGVQVLYEIGDISIDYTHFPEKISASRFEELFINSGCLSDNEIEKITTWYELIDSDDIYQFNSYENMSGVVKRYLQKYMYDQCGYTIDDTKFDNEDNGIFISLEKPYFEVAIEYTLTENGFEATILEQSIYEEDFAPIVNLDVLPYFGTASVEDTGYMVIPDGSGAIMNLNNEKYYHKQYAKRIYGLDESHYRRVMPEQEEKIMLPLFGLVKENINSGFMVIFDEGAPMSSIIADVSGRKDSYNKIYPRVHYRESQTILFGPSYDRLNLDKWTKQRAHIDFKLKYNFLTSDKASYTGIATEFKDYLITKYNYTKVDTSRETMLNLNIIGAFDNKEFFLGVPYNKIDSLTTFEETEIILEELKHNGITNINLIYEGWFNSGISQSFPKNIDIESSIGGKKDFKDLIKYTSESNISLYPQVSLMRTSDYNIMFGASRFSSRTVDGSLVATYPYDAATKLMDKTKSPSYVVSPYYYKSIINSFVKKYNSFDNSNLMFDNLGSIISSDYQKKDILYRDDAIRYQVEVINSLSENNISNIASNETLGYMIPHSKLILNAPIKSSLYQIFDDTIPFYQLVLSGFVDYSSISVNGNSEYDVKWHTLKAIETGSNINFVWSYEDSSVLLGTNYEYYYYTNYKNWIGKAIDMVDELNEIGIHGGSISDHQILSKGIYLVTYSNGVEILINYTNLPYEYDGNTVNAEDYNVISGVITNGN